MMPTTTRKRKLPSLDSDSQPAKKGVREEASPVKRRSPRKKPAGRLDKENCPSPRKSPRRPADSPAKSPRKSAFKPSVVTSSFYGRQKPVYLTPLERKAIKESLPSPPRLPAPSPPSQEKKKNKKNVKGGSKPRKAAAGSSKAGKAGLKSYGTSSATKTIRLPKLSVAAKPAPTTSTAPPSTTTTTTTNKPAESKKAITISFSSLKPKPKIFVGAAFFGTGKKPTSMYKKSTPKSSTRPASAPVTSKAAQPQTKTEKMKPPAPVMKQQKHPEETAVQPVDAEENQPSTKQRARFDPTDWMDCGDDQPETPQTLSSPKTLTGKHGITKELQIVLTRTPTPSTQGVSLTDDGSVPSFDLSDVSPTSAAASPPKGTPCPSSTRRLEPTPLHWDTE